jgi:hypothetical protein
MNAIANTSQQQPRRARVPFRPWWPWLVTFAAFPPAGLLARAVAGPVDGWTAAAIAGVTAGAILGTGQWLLLRRRGISVRWIAGTAAGFTVGLTIGAAAVGYRTDRLSLVIMGALSGASVAALQAVAVRTRPLRTAVWTVSTAALWSLGWTVTSGVIEVDERWAVFGSAGAITVVLIQSTFIERVLPLGTRKSDTEASSRRPPS